MNVSGLEAMRAIRNGEAERPGVGRLLDMRVVTVDEGLVEFEIDAKPEFGNPLGTVHGGITATILDSAMGCAVHTALPPGASYTTLDLAVTYLRAVPYDGRRLTAEGRTIHVGGRVATAQGRVLDEYGTLVATATTTCMVFREAATAATL